MDNETGRASSQQVSPSEALQRFQPPAGASTSIGIRQASMSISRFGFRIGQFHLLIQPNTLSEVIIHASIYPIPSMPAWFVGTANIRGNLIPVFDLHHLLETGEPGKTQTVLVLDQGADGVGMLIDGLPHAVHVRDALNNMPPLHEALQEYVIATYATESGVWLDFDHRGFFTVLGWRLAS